MKVLFLIPTYNNAPILNRSLGFMQYLTPQPTRYIFFENNSQDETWNVLKAWKKLHYNSEIIRMWFQSDAVKTSGSAYGIIGLIRQYLLKRARQLNPDYAIFIDDDVFIADRDFITRMTGWNHDLVGGPYLRAYPQGVFLASKWLNLGEDKNKLPYVLRKKCSGLQEVFMTSGGCMCISNKLLMDTRINFLPIYTKEDTSEDYGYCIKARKHGYKIHLDCTLKMGHFLKTDNYKPWAIKSGVKYDPSRLKTEYVDFKYGREKELTLKRKNDLGKAHENMSKMRSGTNRKE